MAIYQGLEHYVGQIIVGVETQRLQNLLSRHELASYSKPFVRVIYPLRITILAPSNFIDLLNPVLSHFLQTNSVIEWPYHIWF